MPWTYFQSTGKLCNRADQCVATGYNGAPAGKNNPAMQNVEKVGPIPRGGYMIEEPFNDPIHGPYAIHLTPDAANVLYGRDGFLMHGDSLEHPGAASEGCIIMPRPAREAVWNSSDHRLLVA